MSNNLNRITTNGSTTPSTNRQFIHLRLIEKDWYGFLRRATDLELEFHAGDRVTRQALAQLLYLQVEIARRYLRVARLDGLEDGVVYEDVLVLGLDHVVALRAQAGHVAVDVDGPNVLDPLEHRVDDDERSGATDAGAVNHNSGSGLIVAI